MKKAYSYQRFSSPEQSKGRSRPRQAALCEAYCREHGLDLVTDTEYTFLDEGKSAFTKEHLNDETGQLARFIRKVDDGSIGVGSYLIVESLDRLGRDRVADALTRFMSLLDKGINIVTLTDRRLFTRDYTAMDLMMSIVVMARAHEESSTKAMRVGDAFRRKQQDAREFKKPMGAAIPLWLKLEDGRYQPVEDQAKIVKQVFDMCIAGHGRIATCKVLNAQGALSPKGTTWGASTIDKILKNRAVLGEYQPFTSQGGDGKRRPHGAPILDYYPRVIDDDTFYRAHAAFGQRDVGGSTKQTPNFNVWSGIIKCAYCEKSMHVVNKGKLPKGRTYLRCSSTKKGTCEGRAVRLNQTEEIFRQVLVRVENVALVQDNALKLERDLAVITARLTEKNSLLGEYREILTSKVVTTIVDLAYACEQDVKELESQSDALKRLLSAERFSSYHDFLTRVDLVSFDGRSRANALLKRLGYTVYYGSGYFVKQDGVPQFALAYSDGEIGHLGLDGAEGYEGTGEEVTTSLLRMMKTGQPFVKVSPSMLTAGLPGQLDELPLSSDLVA